MDIGDTALAPSAVGDTIILKQTLETRRARDWRAFRR